MAAIQFSGLASGIDSGALIDSVIKARDIRNEIRRQEIDQISSENDALDTLREKLIGLKDLVEKFRSVNGGGISKKASSSDSNIASAIAGSNASNSSFSLSISSLANTASASFDQTYSAKNSKVSTSGSGNLTFTVGTGSSQSTITVPVVANSTTLEELAEAVNASSRAEGKLAASVVNVGTTASPSYKLMLNSLNQGIDKGSLAISAAPAITELQAQTLTQATNAQFTVSGINGTVSREGNSISDLMNGVTINLAATGNANISVANDANSTTESFQEIIKSYNDIVQFINENDLVERIENGERVRNAFGPLAKTRLDNEFLGSFRSKLVEANSENGTTVRSFSEMGISTNRDGTLAFDEDKFKEAVSSDAIGVGEVINSFAESVGGTTGVIYQYTRFNGSIDLAKKSNRSIVENLNNAIDQLDRTNDKLRERLEGQFARLESLSGALQSQTAALSGVIQSMNANRR